MTIRSYTQKELHIYDGLTMNSKLTCVGKTSELSMLLYRGTHPVDFGITTDGLVEGINHDHLNKLQVNIVIRKICSKSRTENKGRCQV